MSRKWVNLADLSSARKPDRGDHRPDNVNSERPQLPRVRGGYSRDREPDRADDRDEQDQSDRDDGQEDVDRA